VGAEGQALPVGDIGRLRAGRLARKRAR